jgi:glyoxylase-like metal-dependent hydrolase (beta-lactamase superfamily II)
MKFRDFKIHVYKGHMQNNFLIEYRDKILLIDGGSRPDAASIPGYLEEKLGKTTCDIKLIAVTHCHPDHAGAAGFLRRKFGIPVAAHNDIDIWYSGISGAFQHISDILQARFMAIKLKSRQKLLYYSNRISPDYRLDDMSPLPFFKDWTAIHAPGHTTHNMMLYNKKNRILYVADTIIESSNRYMPPIPVLFPAAMKETLDKIRKLKPGFLLLAHSTGAVIPYSQAIIDEVLNRLDSRMPLYIRFFYLIAKFTGEYRKHKEQKI